MGKLPPFGALLAIAGSMSGRFQPPPILHTGPAQMPPRERNGTWKCKCGKTISYNKDSCKACAEVSRG